MTHHLSHFIEHPRTQTAIIILIILNAIILGLETSATMMAEYGVILHFLDRLILGVFIIEIIIKFICYRWQFFRHPWSVFDFIIVAIALIPATNGLAVLRSLRVLRVLRLVSTIPSMRRVVDGLLASLPGMGSVVALLILIFYVFSVMATRLFGNEFPQWFSTVGESAYSLFQIMTLESWSMGIVRPVMEIYPTSWVFFVPFILFTSFAVLNLFIGIIVDAMNHESNVQQQIEKQELQAALKRIEAKLERLENRHEDS